MASTSFIVLSVVVALLFTAAFIFSTQYVDSQLDKFYGILAKLSTITDDLTKDVAHLKEDFEELEQFTKASLVDDNPKDLWCPEDAESPNVEGEPIQSPTGISAVSSNPPRITLFGKTYEFTKDHTDCELCDLREYCDQADKCNTTFCDILGEFGRIDGIWKSAVENV